MAEYLRAIPDHWQRPLALLAGAWAMILAALWRDVADLIDLWWNSSTFSHCLLLIPVIGWLVWLRRAELAKLSPRGWWPGLIWIAGAASIWAVGDAASVNLFRQVALIMMLQGTVAAILGPQVTRGLLFPLFYAFFLVPFGEELVPPMQLVTADMAMILLKLFGIPAHIEGIFITTPGGYFAVAEACSGVKFLVAMAALSVLAAHVCFESWKRRLIFLAFAMIVPVLANGVRAFSTILIAEYYGTEFAAGADHIIYGWVFFGLVILLVGLVARPWFDRAADDVPIDGDALAVWWPGRGAPVVAAAAAAIALALLPLGWSSISAARSDTLPPIAVPAVPGWLAQPPPPILLPEGVSLYDWTPRFDGHDQFRRFTLVNSDGVDVDIVIAAYTRQGEGRDVVGFAQGAVDPDGDWRWARDVAPIDGAHVEHLVAPGKARDVLSLYSVGGDIATSPRAVKWSTLRARLTGGDQRTYAVLVSAPSGPNRPGRDAIAAFVSDAGGVDALVRRLTTAP